jgi:hypothetical protein
MHRFTNGYDDVTRTGAAVYLTGEDVEGKLHLRQERINHALGIDMDQLAGRLFVRPIVDRDLVSFPMASRLRC